MVSDNGWSLKRGLILPLGFFYLESTLLALHICTNVFQCLHNLYKLSTADYLDYLKKLHIENPILALSYTIFLIGWTGVGGLL